MEFIIHSLKHSICDKWIYLLLFENILIYSQINLTYANEHLSNVGDVEQWEDFQMEDENSLWDIESGPWLDMFEDTAKSLNNGPHYIQGDDPGVGNLQNRDIPLDPDAPIRCPDIPETVNSLACLLPNCTNNKDCILPFQLCCYNGCLKTCLAGVKDSAVIDWQIQPLAIDEEKHGDAWLIHDEETENNIAPGSCLFEKRIFRDGVDFIYQRHPCMCLDGDVSCSVYGDMPHDQIPEYDRIDDSNPLAANNDHNKN